MLCLKKKIDGLLKSAEFWGNLIKIKERFYGSKFWVAGAFAAADCHRFGDLEKRGGDFAAFGDIRWRDDYQRLEPHQGAAGNF